MLDVLYLAHDLADPAIRRAPADAGGRRREGDTGRFPARRERPARWTASPRSSLARPRDGQFRASASAAVVRLRSPAWQQASAGSGARCDHSPAIWKCLRSPTGRTRFSAAISRSSTNAWTFTACCCARTLPARPSARAEALSRTQCQPARDQLAGLHRRTTSARSRASKPRHCFSRTRCIDLDEADAPANRALPRAAGSPASLGRSAGSARCAAGNR